jgi:hypothetical protein
MFIAMLNEDLVTTSCYQVVDAEDSFRVERLAVNILHTSGTSDRGGPPELWV